MQLKPMIATTAGLLMMGPALAENITGTCHAPVLIPETFETVTEQVLHRTDVERVTAAWMVNSVRGWVPMTIDATTSPDPVGDRAAQHQP